MGGGKTLINNIIYRLVLPTMGFSILFYFPKILIRGESFSSLDFLCDTIGGGSIWFTPALAVAEMLIVILLLLRPKKLFSFVFFAATCWIVSEYLRFVGFRFVGNASVPWYYKSGMEAISIMVLGGFYWRCEKNIHRLLCKSWRIICLSILYMFLCLSLKGIVRTALDWQGLNLLGLFLSLLGIIIIIEWVSRLPSIPFLNYVGRHSIGFYFFCGSVVNVFALLARHLLIDDYGWIVWLIAGVSFLFSSMCVYVIDKWVPFVYDLRKLKRSSLSIDKL